MADIVTSVIDMFLVLLTAPLDYPDMLWILTPLFLTMIFTELYFARYKFEELGWNSAYGNVLVLIFVAIDLFRFLYVNNELAFVSTRNTLVITLTILGVVMSVANFLHVWSKEVAFGISSKLPINFLAYVAVVIIYADITINLITLIASIGVLAVFILLILGMRIIIPKAIELDEDEYRERENAPVP